MEHAAQFTCLLFFQNRDCIFLSFPRMDHDGQSQFARELHLFSKALALDLSRRMIVVVVEADLAVGDDLFISG